MQAQRCFLREERSAFLALTKTTLAIDLARKGVGVNKGELEQKLILKAEEGEEEEGGQEEDADGDEELAIQVQT